MRLIRGWEEKYSPGKIGGLRLSKASVYRTIDEEDGVGDYREGEVRTRVDGGYLTIEWESKNGLPPGLRQAIEKHEGSTEEDEEMRSLFAKQDDDPDLAFQRIGPGRWSAIQNVVVSDQDIDRPFLFCLSREPLTRKEWEKLCGALPSRYDTWTLTENVEGIQFEIECGIKRWLAIQEITRYNIGRVKGFVTYSYESAPPSGDPTDVFGMQRWFRKRKKYRDQAEFRLAWSLSSEQWENMPETMDVELTRTGLSLFKPWTTPIR